MTKKKLLFSAIFNIIISLITLTCIIVMFFSKQQADPLQPVGFYQFRFFTILSNAYFLIIAIIYGIINIMEIKKIDFKHPLIIDELYFSASIALMVTLFTVFFFLSFTIGLIPLLKGVNFVFHFLTPMFGIIGYLLFIPNRNNYSFIHHLHALLPMSLYASLYIIMVILIGADNGGWPDFYGFNSGVLENKWFISVIMMYLLNILLIYLEYKLKRLVDKKKGENNA